METRAAGLETLGGKGQIAIRPGRIQGFSLAKQVMGSLAAVPALALAAKGKDLSKYESEEFDHLTADYTIADGRVHTDNLELAYQDMTAYLHGSDRPLRPRAGSVSGKVVITKNADAQLAGTGRAKERTIPITQVSGTYDSPRARARREGGRRHRPTPTWATSSVKKKLDKALGPGAGEAVQSVLDGLLGGGGNDGGDGGKKKKK